MLAELTSVEITEWAAYFKVKQQREKDEEKARAAQAKAKR